jgi:hypothetical protein
MNWDYFENMHYCKNSDIHFLSHDCLQDVIEKLENLQFSFEGALSLVIA